MISNYRWQQMALESRLKHRERYGTIEDVDAVIADLQDWLATHSPT